MKNSVLKILPYFITSVLVIIYWKIQTSTSNYAWNPKGKQILFLEIALSSIFYYKTIYWLILGNILAFIYRAEKKKKKVQLWIAIVSISIVYIFGGMYVNKKCAKFYYIVFLNQSVSEEHLEEPILKGGREVGKYLTETIDDKNMKYRRYAIRGIGKIEYYKAIPTLEKILLDNSEPAYIKEDVVQALQQMNDKKAQSIVEHYKK